MKLRSLAFAAPLALVAAGLGTPAFASPAADGASAAACVEPAAVGVPLPWSVRARLASSPASSGALRLI